MRPDFRARYGLSGAVWSEVEYENPAIPPIAETKKCVLWSVLSRCLATIRGAAFCFAFLGF